MLSHKIKSWCRNIDESISNIIGNSITFKYTPPETLLSYTQLASYVLSYMDKDTDNVFEMIYVSYYIWTLKGDKSLNCPQIQSQRVQFFKISYRACPQSPSVDMCYLPVCFATMRVHIMASPTLTMMTNLVVPPFQKSISTHVLHLTVQ